MRALHPQILVLGLVIDIALDDPQNVCLLQRHAQADQVHHDCTRGNIPHPRRDDAARHFLLGHHAPQYSTGSERYPSSQPPS